MAEATEMRTPIACVVGHVDSGKTTFLDFLRHSSVQGHEAGGITQQIGSTYFTKEALMKMMGGVGGDIGIPGLMTLDTPGHDCFTNLRMVGIECCDIAIVVVNIIKGLEFQTLEALKLLRDAGKPMIVVANKLDTLAEWTKVEGETNFKKVMRSQDKKVNELVSGYMDHIVVQMAEQELNARPYYNNPDISEFVSIVPISSTTGIGIPNFLKMLSTLLEKCMVKKLKFREDLTRGYVMEVKKSSRHGDTATVILANGVLRRGDRCWVNSAKGPLETTVNDIFLPEDMKEIKDGGRIVSVAEVRASHGVLVRTAEIESVIPGSQLLVFHDDAEKEKMFRRIQADYDKMTERLAAFEYAEGGIEIHATSVGAIESVRSLFNRNDVPISKPNIGKLKKKEVMRVGTILASKSHTYDQESFLYNRRFAVLVVYGMEVPEKIQAEADKARVTIIADNIIYRLIERYQAFVKELDTELYTLHPGITELARVSILKEFIFHKTPPYVFGVRVTEGELRKGATFEITDGVTTHILGRIDSIQKDHSEVEVAKEGDEVCLKLVANGAPKLLYGRQFDHTWEMSTHYEPTQVEMLARFPAVFPQKPEPKKKE